MNTDQNPIPISEQEPQFDPKTGKCWLFEPATCLWWRGSERSYLVETELGSVITHWLPDQPTVPTCVPGETPDPRRAQFERSVEREKRIRADVFNPNESDLQYYARRKRELGLAQPTPEAVPQWAARAEDHAHSIACELHVEAFKRVNALLPVPDTMAIIKRGLLEFARHAPQPPVGDSAIVRWCDTHDFRHSVVSGTNEHVVRTRGAEGRGNTFSAAILAAMRSGREGEKS